MFVIARSDLIALAVWTENKQVNERTNKANQPTNQPSKLPNKQPTTNHTKKQNKQTHDTITDYFKIFCEKKLSGRKDSTHLLAKTKKERKKERKSKQTRALIGSRILLIAAS